MSKIKPNVRALFKLKLNPITNSAKVAREITAKAAALSQARKQYENHLSRYEDEAWRYDMYGGEAHYGVPYSAYTSKTRQLDQLASKIANLEYDLGVRVGDPLYLPRDKYYNYMKGLEKQADLFEELRMLESEIPSLTDKAFEIESRILDSYGSFTPEFNVKSYAEEGSGLTAALDRINELKRTLGLDVSKRPVQPKTTLPEAEDDLPFKYGGKIKSVF